MFGLVSLWRTFTRALLYITLAVGLGGLAGNGLVLWHLGLHIRKGPLSVYVLHLAAADFLFLGCQVAFSVVRAALGADDEVHHAVSFLAFAAGLWLLAAFSLERCVSEALPARCGRWRPRRTSAAVCGLIWALSLPAVLLPARACGLLRAGWHPACLPYQAASMAWLAALAGVACGAAFALLLRAACCSPRPRPRFYGAVLGSALLLPPCALPYALHWGLRPLLGPLPGLRPLAALLACVPAACRPLIYLAAGRRPGKRECVREILRRALGDGAPPAAGAQALPMGAV